MTKLLFTVIGALAGSLALAAAVHPGETPGTTPEPNLQVAQAAGPGMVEEFEMEALLAEYKRDGRPLYQANCASCHGAAGEGGNAAPLDGNRAVRFRAAEISEILVGNRDHAFADELSHTELAAVATFVATAWSNDFGLIHRDTVKAARE